MSATLRKRGPRLVDTSAEAPARKRAEAELLAMLTDQKAKNAANRDETAHKKDLHSIMAGEHVDDVKVTFGSEIVTATIAAGEKKTVDVQALYKKVDLKTFLGIVQASEKAVKDAVGSNVAAAVTDTNPTDPDLRINKVKV